MIEDLQKDGVFLTKGTLGRLRSRFQTGCIITLAFEVLGEFTAYGAANVKDA